MRSHVVAILCAAAALGAPASATASAASPPYYWSLTKLMRMLDGTRIRVGTRVVRLDRETMLCSGIGRGVRENGVRKWQRFDCTFSAFVAGRPRDCEIRVVVVGARRLSLRNPRWIGGAP